MHVNGQRVVADMPFLRVLSVVFCGRLFLLLGLQLARAVGDVAGAVEQGRDADAGAAAGDFYGHAGLDLGVSLGPFLGEVHHRVGTDVLDRQRLGFLSAVAAAFAAAGEEQRDCRSAVDEGCGDGAGFHGVWVGWVAGGEVSRCGPRAPLRTARRCACGESDTPTHRPRASPRASLAPSTDRRGSSPGTRPWCEGEARASPPS